MGRRILVLILFLFSCTERKLTVADLKFPDPEKEGIMKNHVSEMLGVASMQIANVDTTFRSTYDKQGHAIRISPYPFEEQIYRYDSMNLPDSLYERSWDSSVGYKIIPTFDGEATVLYMYYFDPRFKADRYVEALMFDGYGRLTKVERHYLKHTAFRNPPAFRALKSKPEYTAEYFYDDEGRLVRDSSDYEYVMVHKYYYSDRLDSMIYTRTDRARFYEEQRTYYGGSGLRESTRVMVRNGGKDSGASQYAYTIGYSYKSW